MLDELLDDWATDSIPDTGHISLWDQVKSELEARFAKALEDWAVEAAPAVLYRRGAVLNGHRTADLHISRDDGQVVHWKVTLQNTIEGTTPDVLFKRVDAAPLTVAVYLDGYTYHAAPDKIRLADDADKRARLRADGTVVFQLNWEDVDAAAGERGGRHEPWHPYQGNAEASARGAYAQLNGDPAELPGFIWTTPVRTLFAFLADPDGAAWFRRALAAVAGLLRQPGAELVKADQRTIVELIRAAVRGDPIASDGNSPITLVRAADANGCPITLLIDSRCQDADIAPLGGWSALAVIDDRQETIAADAEGHERRLHQRLLGRGLGCPAAAGLAAGRAGPPDPGGRLMKVQLRLLDKADKEISRLPRGVKGAIYDFQRKFREDPSSHGLQLKQLEGNSRLYSARVTDAYPALLLIRPSLQRQVAGRRRSLLLHR